MFEVGKKVIAIKSHESDIKQLYKSGDVFELKAVAKGCKHFPVVLDIGISIHFDHGCRRCNIWNKGNVLVDAANFLPFDDSLSTLTDHDIIYSEEEITITHP